MPCPVKVSCRTGMDPGVADRVRSMERPHAGGQVGIVNFPRWWAAAAVLAVFAAGCGSSPAVVVRSPTTTPPPATAPAPATASGTATPSATATGGNAQHVTVTPATGLRAAQQVLVQASGFSPGESLVVTQCAAKGTATGPGDCDLTSMQGATADASGRIKLELTVSKGPFGANKIVCGPAQACLISVTQATPSPTEEADAPIAFGLSPNKRTAVQRGRMAQQRTGGAAHAEALVVRDEQRVAAEVHRVEPVSIVQDQAHRLPHRARRYSGPRRCCS
jgi:neocarzinostatin family protein